MHIFSSVHWLFLSNLSLLESKNKSPSSFPIPQGGSSVLICNDVNPEQLIYISEVTQRSQRTLLVSFASSFCFIQYLHLLKNNRCCKLKCMQQNSVSKMICSLKCGCRKPLHKICAAKTYIGSWRVKCLLTRL